MSREPLGYLLAKELWQQYCAIFMCGIYAGCVSIALTLTVVLSAYMGPLGFSSAATAALAVAVMLMVVVIHCHFMMVRGNANRVWGVAGVFLFCFLTVLPAIFFQIHKVAYVVGLCAPLTGLFVLNTLRHREMRQAYVRFRQFRKDAASALAVLRSRESKRRVLYVRRLMVRVGRFFSR